MTAALDWCDVGLRRGEGPVDLSDVVMADDHALARVTPQLDDVLRFLRGHKGRMTRRELQLQVGGPKKKSPVMLCWLGKGSRLHGGRPCG